MGELFNNIIAKIPEQKSYDYKNKIQVLLTDIAGEWYTNKVKKI